MDLLFLGFISLSSLASLSTRHANPSRLLHLDTPQALRETVSHSPLLQPWSWWGGGGRGGGGRGQTLNWEEEEPESGCPLNVENKDSPGLQVLLLCLVEAPLPCGSSRPRIPEIEET